MSEEIIITDLTFGNQSSVAVFDEKSFAFLQVLFPLLVIPLNCVCSVGIDQMTSLSCPGLDHRMTSETKLEIDTYTIKLISFAIEQLRH